MKKWHYHFLLLLMALLWGAAWSWGRAVVQEVSPLVAAAGRFWIASLALLPWLIYRQQIKPLFTLSRKQFYGLFIASLFGVFGYSICFMYAMQYVPASKAATTAALNSVVPTLAAAWLFKEYLNGKILLGILTATYGGLFAISRGSPIDFLSGSVGAGEYWLLLSVLCWTGYALVGRMVLRGISPLITTLATSLMGAVLLTAFSFWLDGQTGWLALWQASQTAQLSLFALGFGGTSLAYLWYFAGIQNLGVGTASSYLILVPIFGIAIAVIWLNEPLDLSLIIGGALVLVGMLLMNWARSRLNKNATH